MSNIDDIFLEFYNANDLEGRTVFGKGRFYSFRGEEYTKEQLIETADFAGFSDAYQGKENKYDLGEHSSGMINALNMAECIMADSGHGNLFKENETVNNLVNQDVIRYNRQYNLGKIFS